MNIKKIKMNNFRQFYGEHELEFLDNDKNTTLIVGENGSGKTSIFRALMFVLYGESRLSQDGFDGDMHIVNLHKLDETHENEPVTATVELSFEHQGKSYIIERSFSTIRMANRLESQIGDAKLWELSSVGDQTPKSMEKHEIDQFVDRIIDKKIRDFFFFDAERIDLLDTTKSNRALSDDVKDGIVRLLQIKYLEDSINTLQGKIKEIQRGIDKKIKDETYDNTIRELEARQERLDKLEKQQELLRKEMQGIEIELEHIRKKLGQNENIRVIQERISDKTKHKDDLLKNREDFKKNLRDQILKAINHLASEILQRNKPILDSYVKTSRDRIPISILKQSLAEQLCFVCQTKIENNSPQIETLKKLIDNYESSEFTGIANVIISLTTSLKDEKKDHLESLRNSIKIIVDNNEKLEELLIELEKLNSEIGSSASTNKDLEILDIKREELNKELISKKDDLATTNLTINQLEEEISSLDERKSRLSKKFEEVKKEQEINNRIESLKITLETTMERYTTSVTEELSKTVFQIFLELINEKDRDNYTQVVINDKYEILLLDRANNNVVQDLSMGQGQIFSLAFVLALARLASKGRDEISFPLFMDTPLARLDATNRDNVIRNVPKLTNQLILLLTDTELTDYECSLFIKYDTVGNIYKLNNVNGRTKIERIDDFNSLV